MVVVPGGRGGTFTPVLAYTWAAAEARDAQIVHVNWSTERGGMVVPKADAPRWVDGEVRPHLDGRAAKGLVLAAKSLGTHAAALAAEHGLPGIWHTPLIADGWGVASMLRRATAPFLLIGGTNDTMWDGELARSLTPHVLEIEDADHALMLTNRPLAESAQALGRVATAVEDFLDHIVWPRFA